MNKYDSRRAIHKIIIIVAVSLALGTATVATATSAFARGGGGFGGHFGGGGFGGHFGGGGFGGHFGGGSAIISVAGSAIILVALVLPVGISAEGLATVLRFTDLTTSRPITAAMTAATSSHPMVTLGLVTETEFMQRDDAFS